MRFSKHSVLVLLAVVTIDATAQTSPVLVPLAPVHLSEPRDAPLGRPTGIGTDPDGGYYVVDVARSMVARFTANGTFVRTYGQAGDGPGELRTPTRVAVVNDTLLAITDVRKRQVSFFHRPSGRFVRRINIPGMLGTIHSRGSDVWIGAMNVETRLGAVRVNATTGSFEPSVALPSIYGIDGSPVNLLAYDVHIVPGALNLVVGFAATNYLITVAPNRATDTISIPVLKRRGIPADLNERVMRVSDARELYEMFSSTIAVERLPNGTMLVAHLDYSWRSGAAFPTTPGGEDPFSYKLYVSLVQITQRRVCVDIPVPMAGSQRLGIAVRGDTLFVFDQDPDNDTQPWQIRRFQIREAQCSWQPVPPKAPAR